MPTIGIKRDLLFKALGKTYCKLHNFFIIHKNILQIYFINLSNKSKSWL